MNFIIKFLTSDIETFIEYNYNGSFWYLFLEILFFIYHIAPIVILLFIARVVWLIYKDE